MLNCYVIVQPKNGNLLLRPFVARKMKMSSDKKGSCRLDPFLIRLMDNNESTHLYESLLIKPSNVELLGSNKQC